MSWTKQEWEWFEEEGEQLRLEAMSKALKETTKILNSASNNIAKVEE